MSRFALAVWLAIGLPSQQNVRDSVTPLPPGTASLAGTVISDEATPRPVRNAIVTLNHTDKLYGDTAVTDGEGRFTFEKIPAGRFLIVAQRDGYIRAAYGAARSGQSGTPMTIADGQRVTSIQVRLPRGAVLTGTIRDPDGQPMPDVAIQSWRLLSTGGERRYVETYPGGEPISDDRGIYRLYDLPAGEYVIQAGPRVGGFDNRGGQTTSTVDLQWARAQLQAGARADAAAPPARSSTAYSPVYYPGTLQRRNAATIKVAACEERTGLDMTMMTVPTSRISGTVTSPTPIAEQPEIFLADVSENSAGFYGVQMASGTKFTLSDVAPGTYNLVVRLQSAKQWAMTQVVVTGADQSIPLSLQPAMTATGRVQFKGTAAAPKDLSLIRLDLRPVGAEGRFAIGADPVPVNADGTFLIEGLMPGRYRLRSVAQLAGGWTLRDARAGGVDITTVPVEIRGGGSITDIAITFTDRPTELGGRLQDASGRAAADYFIVVFSTDDRAWYSQSRAIAQTRPANDGVFMVRGLPAGDYWLAALTDVERDEWFDPAFLRQLVPAAVKVTLVDGEKKTQDIKIAGGGS